MTTDEARALSPGLYRLDDSRGGSLIADVVADADGIRFYRPFGGWLDSWEFVRTAIPLFTFPLTPGLTYLQLLALAVLKGDHGAAMGLLDEAIEQYHGRPSVEERIEAARREEKELIITLLLNEADETRFGTSRSPRYADYYHDMVLEIRYDRHRRTTNAPTT